MNTKIPFPERCEVKEKKGPMYWKQTNVPTIFPTYSRQDLRQGYLAVLHGHWHAPAVSHHFSWIQCRYIRSLVLNASQADKTCQSGTCGQSMSPPPMEVLDLDIRVHFSSFPGGWGLSHFLAIKCCLDDELLTGTGPAFNGGNRVWRGRGGACKLQFTKVEGLGSPWLAQGFLHVEQSPYRNVNTVSGCVVGWGCVVI